MPTEVHNVTDSLCACFLTVVYLDCYFKEQV